MAKRARGSTSRPGQRPPLQRQAARRARPVAASAPASRPDDLTSAEETRAAELEAAILTEERQAEAAKRRGRTAARTADAAAARATSSLAVTAAGEYAYVARDVRRIAIVGGSMVAILLAIWLIAHLTGITVL